MGYSPYPPRHDGRRATFGLICPGGAGRLQLAVVGGVRGTSMASLSPLLRGCVLLHHLLNQHGRYMYIQSFLPHNVSTIVSVTVHVHVHVHV